jgi:hypothetical protein
MKAGKTVSFRQRYETIAPVIGRTFDLEAILRQVVGPRWPSLPADQQAALADAFRRYTIASYVANFDSYSGQRFDTAPVVRAVGNDRVVETRFASPGDRVLRDGLRHAAGRRVEGDRRAGRGFDQPRSSQRPKCALLAPTAVVPVCWSVCGRRPPGNQEAFCSSLPDGADYLLPASDPGTVAATG